MVLFVGFFFAIYLLLSDSSVSKEPAQKPKTNVTNLSQIEKPSYIIFETNIDTDLEIFPLDYDYIISSLDISLTQHQKMSLLLYGESESRSTLTSIQEGYIELIKKDIPILIPKQYIKKYIDEEIERYSVKLNQVPIQLQDIQCNISPTFNSPYQKYIWEEMEKTEFSKENEDDGKDTKEVFTTTNFYLDLYSEDINSALYKMRVLKALSDTIDDTTFLSDFLNDLLIYNQDRSDTNTIGRISQVLGDIISCSESNRDDPLYWKISIIDGKSYLFPVYLSKEYPVEDNNFNIDYDITPLEQSRNSVRVPILMYHHINPVPSTASRFTSGLYVSPDVFEKQLAYLVKKNYKSLTSQEFYTLLSTGKNPSQKSLMLTFDDGTTGQYTNGFPLLKKYGLVGIFYIPSSKSSITYNQLREMAKAGMIIESHSATHIDLAKENNPQRLYSEIVGSRYTLRNATGQPVITISYPGCVADSQTYPYVSQAGYLLGVSCGKSIDHYFKKRLSLSRVHVFNSVENLKDILSGKP